MNCRSCEKELKSEDWNPDADYQFDNALWLGFFGGYSMFVDDPGILSGKEPTLPGAAYEAVICHECAHELCERVPWINELIKPLTSHSHTQEFWAENPEHEGWDKKPIETKENS